METRQKMTLGKARVILQACNVTIKKNEFREFVVTHRSGNTAATYYTDDINDAVKTGLIMGKGV